jgi:hypothetical protein
MNKFKTIFCLFISTLEKFNVRYCVLRGYENLPEGFSNDIDFGVHPTDKEQFFLAVNSFTNLQNGKIFLRNSRYEVLKTTFQIQNLNLDFDFWFDFNYVGLRYMDITRMLTNPLSYNNISVLRTEDELTLSFLKELLHNSIIRLDKIDVLTDRLLKSDSKKVALFFNSNLKEHFSKAILNRDFELKQLSHETKKHLIEVNISKRGFFTTLFNGLNFLLYRFFPRLNPLINKIIFTKDREKIK